MRCHCDINQNVKPQIRIEISQQQLESGNNKSLTLKYTYYITIIKEAKTITIKS